METITISLEKKQAGEIRKIAQELGLSLGEFIQMMAEHFQTESEIKDQYIDFFKNQLNREDENLVHRPSQEDLAKAMGYVLKKNAELYKRLA